MPKPSSHSGFTLIELVTVVAVIGVLLTIAIPSFRTLIFDYRMTSAANELAAMMTLARSEAYKTNKTVTVCATSDPSAATPACNTSGTAWSSGWLIKNANGAIIKVSQGASSVSVSGASHQVLFNPNGLRISGNQTLTLCDSRGASKARGIVIAASGRVRITEAGDASLSC